MFSWVQPRVQYSTMPYTVQYKCYWKHIWLWMHLEYPPQLRYRCRSSTSCQWRLIPKNVISLWLHMVGTQTCIYSGTWRHLLLQMKNTIVSHVKRTTSFPTAWMYWLLVHPAKIFRGWIETEPVSLGVPWKKTFCIPKCFLSDYSTVQSCLYITPCIIHYSHGNKVLYNTLFVRCQSTKTIDMD